MRDNSVESIKGYIKRKNSVKYSYAVNVVVEKPAGFGVINLGEIALTCVTEGRVSYIVTEGNCLDKVEVEIKHRANRARYTRYKLNVKCATGDIVVLIEGKHLRLIGIAIVVGAVHNLINVTHVRRPPDGLLIEALISSDSIRTLRSKVRARVILYILPYSLGNLGRELFIISLVHIYSDNFFCNYFIINILASQEKNTYIIKNKSLPG